MQIIRRITGRRTILEDFKRHYVVKNVKEGLSVFLSDGMTRFAVIALLTLIVLGAFGPTITPYEYNERQYNPDGELLRFQPPSSDHLLGTTQGGYDVLSRILYGARPTLITGFLGGLLIVGIGLTIGVTAGYFGGTVDTILMRFTDFVYGVPLIPFAIVLVTFFGIGFWSTIAIVGGILWRGNARVFRSQVLQIKNRPYVRISRALGANRRHVTFTHILPNMGGMIVLFFALGVGSTIIITASLAFLGVTSPFVPSWGVMLRNAYNSGLMTEAWWWALPPGLLISLTVLSTFLLGRGYERVQETDMGGV